MQVAAYPMPKLYENKMVSEIEFESVCFCVCMYVCMHTDIIDMGL